jgi:hypothetical protein
MVVNGMEITESIDVTKIDWNNITVEEFDGIAAILNANKIKLKQSTKVTKPKNVEQKRTNLVMFNNKPHFLNNEEFKQYGQLTTNEEKEKFIKPFASGVTVL